MIRVFRELAKEAKCATDLHNAFYGIGGKFGEMFPTRKEREAFQNTPEYEETIRVRVEMRKNDKAVS